MNLKSTLAVVATVVLTLSVMATVSFDVDSEGANGNVASVNGQEYSTLQEALDIAQDGDVVRILQDIVLGGDSETAGASIKSGITIDGTNPDGGVFKISSATSYKTIETVEASNIDSTVTFRNLEVDNSSGIQYSRCLQITSLTTELILDNVTLSVTSGSNTQPLTIGGFTNDTLDVTIVNCDIRSSSSGYAVIVFNPVNMTITDTYLEGWSVIYMKTQNGGGSRGSVVTVSDSEIVSINRLSGPSNNFSAIVSEDTDVTITLTDVKVTIGETEGNRQSLFSSNPYTTESGINTFSIGGENTVVNVIGENVTMLNIYQDDTYVSEAGCTVTGGTFIGLNNEDLLQYIDESVSYIVNPDGSLTASSNQSSIPPIIWDDEDDENVPTGTTATSSDDSVTIVACAAAAVVAALMAAFLILDRKR